MIPASLNDELTDFSAKVQHYESKVDDLNRTVDELQDQLDTEREIAIEAEAEARHIRAQQTEVEQKVADRLAEELAARGFLAPPLPPPWGFPGVPPYPYPLPSSVLLPPPPPGDGPAYMRYMASMAPRYARLRQLLSGLTPDAVVASRDIAMRCVAELEAINAALESEIRARDGALHGMEDRERKAREQDRKTAELQVKLRVWLCLPVCDRGWVGERVCVLTWAHT
jgi:Skp family chaperone for outer membrane proteins